MVRKIKSSIKNMLPVRRTRKMPKATLGAGSVTTTPDVIKCRTEEKAFELFERRGYQHGWHDYDWAMAENLVKLESGSRRNKRFKAPKPEIVQRKAYEIFAGRGYTNGQDNVDWYLAEEFAKLETK